MKWIVDNWSLLVVIVAAVFVVAKIIRAYSQLPSEVQISKIKEMLLLWVALAEKEFGKSTGQLKLRYCYTLFVEKFPSLAAVISFDTFSMWVDEVLEQFRHLMETNAAVNEYVEGVEDGESK